MINPASDLVEFASDAAFVIDADSKIVAWNARAEQLLGYTPSEAIGQFCGDILQATLPGGEPLCHRGCDVFQCFQICRPYDVPMCRVRRRDGDWVSASIASIAIPERARRLYANNTVAVVFVRSGEMKSSQPKQHTLQIFALGGFGLVVAGRSVPVEKWKRKHAVTLLKYLVTQLDRPVHRERLVNCLWPDVDEMQGWGRLKVTMYYLRRELRAYGLSDGIVKTTGNAYLLRRDAVWVDADDFERLVADGRILQDQRQWNDALSCYGEAQHLYRGEYFEDETFVDWCAEERERLHEINLEMLARTAACHAELEQYAAAIHICRKALVFDPCREHIHCALMQYLASSGLPDMALAQFRHCQQVLAQEFGVEPLPETRSLYQKIIDAGDTAEASGIAHC